MKKTSKKIQELIGNFPFVSDILLTEMKPLAPLTDCADAENLIDDLTIRIQKADRDLMYRKANNVGLVDSSSFFFTSGGHINQVMKQGEYFFAIDSSGKILNCVNWLRKGEEDWPSGEIYGWAVLWSSRFQFPNGEWGYSNPIWGSVKYLAWVTVQTYHVDTKNDELTGGRFGKFLHRSINITIYGEPDEGFEKLAKNANVYENLFLDNQTVMTGCFEKSLDITRMLGMLDEICISFQDEVYFNGMKQVLDNGEYRGASGQFGAVKVLCVTMCGYERIMLEDHSSYVSFQLRPDSRYMYVLGQNGTLPQIRNLVRTVTRMWNQKPESRETFKPNENVSVF